MLRVLYLSWNGILGQKHYPRGKVLTTNDKQQKKKKKKLPSTATALANERKRINDRIRTSMIGKHFLVFTFYMQFYAFNLFIEFINTDRGCFSAYCKNCAEK